MTSIQLSDWSSKPPLALRQFRSYTETNSNACAENISGSRNQSEATFQWLPVIGGFVVSVLVGGIVLASVMTLWLTTSSTTITTASPSLSSSSMSSTTRTATTTTATQTTTACSVTGRGTLLHQSGIHPWAQYSYNYTATATTQYLIFAFENGSGSYTYLDDVSVVDNNASSIQLLQNPSFENSTSMPPTGWVYWCSSMCTGSGSLVGVFYNSTCHTFPGNCYGDHCYNGPDFLGQSFSAIIGYSYTISFWMQQTGGGLANLFVDIN